MFLGLEGGPEELTEFSQARTRQLDPAQLGGAGLDRRLQPFALLREALRQFPLPGLHGLRHAGGERVLALAQRLVLFFECSGEPEEKPLKFGMVLDAFDPGLVFEISFFERGQQVFVVEPRVEIPFVFLDRARDREKRNHRCDHDETRERQHVEDEPLSPDEAQPLVLVEPVAVEQRPRKFEVVDDIIGDADTHEDENERHEKTDFPWGRKHRRLCPSHDLAPCRSEYSDYVWAARYVARAQFARSMPAAANERWSREAANSLHRKRIFGQPNVGAPGK